MANSNSAARQVFAFRLDLASGVPVYRQLIDQVLGAMASSVLRPGDRLPTVRQVAVDLAINPNTVVRAYKELEIRGALETQQGTGTFVSSAPVEVNDAERRRQVTQIVTETAAKAGAAGITLDELIESLNELRQTQRKEKR